MMMHQNRVFGVRNIESIDALAETLTEMTWILCTGFRLQGLLFLNDSWSEDHAQEYAVVRESDMCQLESITFSWCDKAQAISYIKQGMETTDGWFFGKLDNPVKIKPYQAHHCRFCA